MSDVALRRQERATQAPAATTGREVGRRVRVRPVRQPPPPLGGGAVVALWSAAVVSALCLWLVFTALVLGPVQYRADQGRLYDTLRLQLADGTAPLGATAVGSPVALLNGPGGGIHDAVVLEGTASRQTQSAPGHRRNTALPGQPGVAVLVGRGTTYGAPFGDIAGFAAGDQITATTGQGEFVYVVEGVRHTGDPLPAPLPQGGSRLTLAAAEGAALGNGLRAQDVVYVDALLKGTPRPPSSVRPSTITAGEELMSGDRRAILPLLLWMQALLVVGCAIAWAQARWGLW